MKLARRCNDYAAELNARWPKRFGAFALVPMFDMRQAVDEIGRALDTLKLQGVCLFASYSEKFLGDPFFDPVLQALDERDAVVFVHPALHPSSRGLDLPWPAFMMEYLFDTTRATVNLVFGGAIERFRRIRFVLAHAGGLVPYFAWRLSVSPMIDRADAAIPREEDSRPVHALLVRHRALAGGTDDHMSDRRCRTGPDRLRQRLAVCKPEGHCRGGVDLGAIVGFDRAARGDRPRQRARALSAILLISYIQSSIRA